MKLWRLPQKTGGCFLGKKKQLGKHPRQHSEGIGRSPVPNTKIYQNVQSHFVQDYDLGIKLSNIWPHQFKAFVGAHLLSCFYSFRFLPKWPVIATETMPLTTNTNSGSFASAVSGIGAMPFSILMAHLASGLHRTHLKSGKGKKLRRNTKIRGD